MVITLVDPDIKKDIALLFRARDFQAMWYNLSNWYKNLGFTDELTDAQRIEEYKWIVQQLRKYMFSKQDDIMSCDSVDEMLEKVQALISKASEYGDDRKTVVYNFMRDQWLLELHSVLENILDALVTWDEEDEEE